MGDNIQITTRQSAQSSSAADAKQSSSSAASAPRHTCIHHSDTGELARLTRFISAGG